MDNYIKTITSFIHSITSDNNTENNMTLGQYESKIRKTYVIILIWSYLFLDNTFILQISINNPYQFLISQNKLKFQTNLNNLIIISQIENLLTYYIVDVLKKLIYIPTES